MEQSNGPIQQPLHAASADPAFVPGLTGVVAPLDDAPEPEDRPEDAVVDEAEESDVDAVVDSDVDSVVDSVDEDAAPAAAGAGGPVFEAADRRGRIVADAEGVRLSYDEEACEFRWDEIAAVESGKGRFGKRFTVTVHTPDRRWYPIEIIAPDRGHITGWEAGLDAVLDAYFDEAS
ncbi:hypothetical protein ABZ621_18695 [Streptomyces sp. NPDC007863]|uniref:hypothetical protein n=1 Tax=Streptomyces sp. NPDC007863 TaxID=3154894 RepID=UPI0033CEDEC8